MLSQYLVVISGSGGSLDALVEFFDHTPLDNASYIILRHLPYEYQSTLDVILRRHSKLSVVEAVNDRRIENNTIYFAPPGKQMIILDRKLKLNYQKKRY